MFGLQSTSLNILVSVMYVACQQAAYTYIHSLSHGIHVGSMLATITVLQQAVQMLPNTLQAADTQSARKCHRYVQSACNLAHLSVRASLTA